MAKIPTIAVPACILLLTLNGCRQEAESKHRPPSPEQVAVVSGAHDQTLSATELHKLKALARRGDANAAFKVALHFEPDPASEAQTIEWLGLASSHGHQMATQHLMVMLNSIGGRPNCERAKRLALKLAATVSNAGDRESLGLENISSEIGSDYEACMAIGRN